MTLSRISPDRSVTQDMAPDITESYVHFDGPKDTIVSGKAGNGRGDRDKMKAHINYPQNI